MHKQSNTSPHGYLSWSQMSLWERDPNLYYQIYIEGLSMYQSKYMYFGSRVHKAIELGYDKENDPAINLIATFIPRYPKREFRMNVRFEYTTPKEIKDIPLYGIIDGWNPWSKEMCDYKTGKNYSQATADRSDQFTFYAIMIWLKYKVYPKKIFVHWIKTAEDEEKGLHATGDFQTFETKRELRDILLLSKRIRMAWDGVCEIGKEANSRALKK